MHRLKSFLLFLVVAYVVIFLIQLWLEAFSADVFFKLTVTFGVLFVTSLVIIFIKQHLSEEAKLKRDKFID